MNILDKIKNDHQNKSEQVRKLKKKLKNRIPISKVKEMLSLEKRNEVNSNHYAGWSNFDDEGYDRACVKREARIELLEQLISMHEKKVN